MPLYQQTIEDLVCSRINKSADLLIIKGRQENDILYPSDTNDGTYCFYIINVSYYITQTTSVTCSTTRMCPPCEPEYAINYFHFEHKPSHFNLKVTFVKHCKIAPLREVFRVTKRSFGRDLVQTLLEPNKQFVYQYHIVVMTTTTCNISPLISYTNAKVHWRAPLYVVRL